MLIFREPKTFGSVNLIYTQKDSQAKNPCWLPRKLLCKVSEFIAVLSSLTMAAT